MADTTIPIDSDVRDELRAEKVGNETYSDVIERLIENNE
jgi:predicted CopG family antitoxin